MSKTNMGLVKYAEKALEDRWGYVWGTFGQTLTERLFQEKIKQYPSGVGNYQTFIRRNWLGKRTADCVGLIKSYMWHDDRTGQIRYNPSTDVNADTMYARAKKKGSIGSIPEVPGLCVWRKGHIGVYIGNGYVIEAQGTIHGVKKHRLRDRNFTHWLECPYIKYETASTSEATRPLIRLNSRGGYVKVLQDQLNGLNFNAGKADGIAGSNTIAAIRRFQRKYGLTVDGIFGENSYEVLDREIKKKEDNLNKPIAKKSEYIRMGDVHIIKTKPDNIEIKHVGNTLQGANEWGVNGTFYDTNTAPVTNPESTVFIAMNDGKQISNNAQFNGWKSPPRATLLYQDSGLMGFRQLTDINPIRNFTIWAIGGYMVKPYMDFKNENIPGSVNYRTAHTYIGYDNYGYIYLIVKPYHMIRDIVPLLTQLGITRCIVVDGGGSSQLRHPDGEMRSTRRVGTIIALKEV